MGSQLQPFIRSLSTGDYITIIATGITLLIATPNVLKRVAEQYKRRAYGFLLPHKVVRIYIPTRDVGRRFFVVSLEDLEAASAIKSSLEKRAYSCNIEYIDPKGEFVLDDACSSVVICGPKNSYIISETFSSLPYFEFAQFEQDWYLVDRGTRNIITSPMDRQPPEDGDLAFLGKVTIPRMPAAPVVLICGIHALGSQCVAAFLQDRRKMASLLKMVGHSKFVSILYCNYSKEQKGFIDTEFYFHPRKIG
jgi:hypothetical protein